MAESPVAGCILGTAVGDALGLPYEGVSRSRAQRLLGPPDRHRFIGRYGMVSDDTEHTCMVAQSLITTGDNLDAFITDFAERVRWWFLLLPAGMGRATLRSSVKLWCGVPPRSSGVWSAGNGPAMRAAIFGAVFDDLDQLVAYVRASSRITHSDPKSERGAIAVALAAQMARQNSAVSPGEYVDRLTGLLDAQDDLVPLLQAAARSVENQESTRTFAETLGLGRGVSGYTLHTVPVVVHAWLANQNDYRSAITSVIECGGDADTTAAIVGGIVGAGTGESGIPTEWLDPVRDWPRSIEWMRQLARQLEQSRASASVGAPVQLNSLAVLSRNLVFLVLVLLHGFRRLLPPY